MRDAKGRFDKGSRPRGQACHNWRGGRIARNGYIVVKLSKDDPFFAMAGKTGYVLEHRLIMAQHLGRPLTKQETVHHINGVRDDNSDWKNLELMPSPNEHNRLAVCAQCVLRKEIRLLRWELKQMREALQEKLRL